MATLTKVQYPCALDEDNNLVFIDDVIRETRHEHTFRCPHCGHFMRPLQGKHNTWCFAHCENQKCGVESFIHSSAKIILAKRFNERKLPFIIGLKSYRNCKFTDTCKEDQRNCHGFAPEYNEYNLQEHYDLPAEIEVDVYDPDRDTPLRPDVLLKSSHPQRNDIFIEVYYKHKCEKEKLESGHQIIEIQVREMNDLRGLETRECFKEGPDVHFYNFKGRSISPDQLLSKILQVAKENGFGFNERVFPACKQSPETKRRFYHLQRYTLYKSGKSYHGGIFENELDHHNPSAIMDVTYDCEKISNFYPGKALARKDQRARFCDFCEHYVQTYDFMESRIKNKWCNIGKNGSHQKGTFDKIKGTYCRDFEWEKSDPFLMGDEAIDPVEGEDYTIWINPEA